MPNHKYRIGQQVTFLGPAYMRGATADYEIVRLLPPEAGQLLYRVKSPLENHERVMTELQLAVRRTA